MAKKQKNATPTREQQARLRAAGLDPRFWAVTKEFEKSMIIRQRFTGEVQLIGKG